MYGNFTLFSFLQPHAFASAEFLSYCALRLNFVAVLYLFFFAYDFQLAFLTFLILSQTRTLKANIINIYFGYGELFRSVYSLPIVKHK